MPTIDDGLKVHELIANSPPLDLNSIYSYYLLCTHFSDTCVIAEREHELAGFLSAYRVPGRTDTLFVWQVVVSGEFRGLRIAARMLDALVSRFENQGVRFVEATVSPDNIPSRRLFESLARECGTSVEESTFLDANAFGAESGHDSEILLRIPLNQ